MPEVDRMTIKAGLIGCGKHALYAHALPSLVLPKFEFTSTYDPSSSSHISFAKEMQQDVNRLSSMSSLLKSDIDCVFIASPDEYHAGTLYDAVKAGKHVFVEKPLAVNSGEVKIVKEAFNIANENGLIILSCHPKRFDPPVSWLKDQLPMLQKQYGVIEEVGIGFNYASPPEDWKRRRSLLLDHASHEIDTLQFLLGASGLEATANENTASEFDIRGERSDGIKFHFYGQTLPEIENPSEQLVIKFHSNSLSMDMKTGKVEVAGLQEEISTDFQAHRSDFAVRSKSVMENFIDAIANPRNAYLSHAEMLLNTAFCVELCEKGSFKVEI